MDAPHPIRMKNMHDRELWITWNDGEVTRHLFRNLRIHCPCAGCVNEWTGERMLDPANIPESVKPNSVSMVGNYAVQFHWSDGHDSGIYTFEALLKMGEPPIGHSQDGLHGAEGVPTA
jgi:DUF971 family protein